MPGEQRPGLIGLGADPGFRERHSDLHARTDAGAPPPTWATSWSMAASRSSRWTSSSTSPTRSAQAASIRPAVSSRRFSAGADEVDQPSRVRLRVDQPQPGGGPRRARRPMSSAGRTPRSTRPPHWRRGPRSGDRGQAAVGECLGGSRHPRVIGQTPLGAAGVLPVLRHICSGAEHPVRDRSQHQNTGPGRDSAWAMRPGRASHISWVRALALSARFRMRWIAGPRVSSSSSSVTGRA